MQKAQSNFIEADMESTGQFIQRMLLNGLESENLRWVNAYETPQDAWSQCRDARNMMMILSFAQQGKVANGTEHRKLVHVLACIVETILPLIPFRSEDSFSGRKMATNIVNLLKEWGATEKSGDVVNCRAYAVAILRDNHEEGETVRLACSGLRSLTTHAVFPQHHWSPSEAVYNVVATISSEQEREAALEKFCDIIRADFPSYP